MNDDYDEDFSETIRSCELRRAREVARIVAQARVNRGSVRTVPFTTTEMAWVDGKWPSPVRLSLAVSYKLERSPQDTDIAEIRAVSISAEAEYMRWLMGQITAGQGGTYLCSTTNICLRCISIANIALAATTFESYSREGKESERERRKRNEWASWCEQINAAIKKEWYAPHSPALPGYSALLPLASATATVNHLLQSGENAASVLAAIDKLRHIILAQTQNP